MAAKPGVMLSKDCKDMLRDQGVNYRLVITALVTALAGLATLTRFAG